MAEVRLKPETVALLKHRALNRRQGIGCFLCSRILEALGAERTLRAWPPGGEQSEFPVDGQRAHVQLETANA